MNILVFDTETTSLEKPFCYNIGYTIVDTDTAERLLTRDYVVEQVWHNMMLFTTAYYANKRPLYVDRMRARQVVMDKYGYIMQQMIRDCKFYDVHSAYAYNSTFDEKVFNYNCDWFKTANPFDNIEIYDILGYSQHFIANTEQYKSFCEMYELFTESGNYSATAENVTRFLRTNESYTEEHTALADSEIETDILLECIKRGAELDTHYAVKKSIERLQLKTLTIKFNNEEIFTKDYTKMRTRKDTIYLN